MKKFGIILASIAGALIVLLAVLLLFGRGKKVESGDDESLYPYSYTQNGKNIVLAVTGDFPQGTRWVARESELVSVETEKQKKNEAKFTINAVGSGSEQLLFTLERVNEGGMNERLYEIHVEVYARSGKVEVISNFHQELAGNLSGEQDGCTYSLASREDGSVEVELQGAGKTDWIPQREGECIYVERQESRVGEGYCRMLISAVNMGQGTAIFCDTERGIALECFVSVDAFGRITVEEHKIVPYVYEENAQ